MLFTKPDFNEHRHNPAKFALSLRCPVCGEDYDVHPVSVRAYFREDSARVGNFAQVSHEQVVASSGTDLPPGNPSGRRDGIVLEFKCWNCDNVLELTIAQHKGPSYVTWGVSPKAAGE